MPYDDRFIREAARRECKRVADEIEALLKIPGYVPRDTGALQNSYHAVATQQGAEIRTNVSYWSDVEYGHRKVNSSGVVIGRVDAQSHTRRAVEEFKNTNRGSP